MKARLQYSFPDLEVEGAYKEPEEPIPTLAGLVQVGYITIMLLIVFGDHVFGAIGIEVPQLIRQAQNSQMWSMFMVYYFGNFITTNMMNTGAFEITFDGVSVWSKIESGRLPSWDELVVNLKSAGLPVDDSQQMEFQQ